MSTNPTADDLVADYLHRLAVAGAGLPAPERAELLEQIGDHVASARADAPAAGTPDGPALVRTVLDRLGTPDEVAAAAGAPAAPPAAAGTGREVVAVLLLGFGWVVGGLGWLVGMVLAWTSPAWAVRQKVLATLLPAPVLLALLVAHTVDASTGASPVAVALPLTLVGLAVTVVLAVRLVRGAGTRSGGPALAHA